MFSTLLVFGSLLLITLLLLVIVARYQRRERSRQADLEVHMAIFTAGIEKNARQEKKSITVNNASNRGPDKAGSSLGSDPDEDSVVRDIYPVDEVYPGWHFGVVLHEEAEQYLGAVSFQSLVQRFANIPGVADCRQEDRELFLFNTRRLSAKQLRTAVWLQFMALADEERLK